MKGKTGFLKIFITSIYDINVFSQYAKEGIIKAVTYILIVCTCIGLVKGSILGYKLNSSIKSITRYLQTKGKNTYIIKDGLLILDSNIADVDRNVYLDNEKAIDEDLDFNEIFNEKKAELLILKDGIEFNNYGSIYALNYSDIFKGDNVKSDTIINTADSFSFVIMGAVILINIIEIVKDLIFNYLLIVTGALLVSIFMKMFVKYKALWSLVIYASTMPLIILTILNILKPNINFDFTFIGGTLTYVILTLKHIKNDIIQRLSNKNIN